MGVAQVLLERPAHEESMCTGGSAEGLLLLSFLQHTCTMLPATRALAPVAGSIRRPWIGCMRGAGARLPGGRQRPKS